MAGRTAGRIVLALAGVLAVLVVMLVVVWTVAGSVVVPLSFEARDVERIQLNGGTLTLTNSSDGRLQARVPLRVLPLLMVRETDGLLEIGGFDDADLRVLIYPLLGASDIPAGVDDIEWELGPVALEQVTVAGGTLRADGYFAERLTILGAAGSAHLRDIDIGTLAVHTQDPAEITLDGHADVYSAMDNGGLLDAAGLDYDEFDRGVIEGILTAP